MNVIVIGGVAAGTKTAAKLKRQDRSVKVTVYTKGKDISYAGCGLPYYVGGSIENREELIVNTPEKYAGLTGKVLSGNIRDKRNRACGNHQLVIRNGFTVFKADCFRLRVKSHSLHLGPDLHPGETGIFFGCIDD